MRVVVMGLGQFGGGVAAASYLARHGARVCVTDLRPAAQLSASCAALADWPIEYVLGEHREADFAGADIVVANPAVSPANPLLRAARAARARVTSEMELFLHGTQASLLMVSGTHGKSSTVTFLHQLLKGWTRPVFLGGNLGRPLLDVPAAWHPESTCVVEISSYQLEALDLDALPAKARTVGLTALAPDHLERHGDMFGYLSAKARLFGLARQGACAWLPEAAYNEAPFARWRSELRPDLRWTAYGPSSPCHWDARGFVIDGSHLACPSPWHLPGDFQRDNVLLALGMAMESGMPAEVAAQRLPALRGLPHRLQRLDLPGERVVFDNGVSTTPESTLAGLEAMPAGAVVLLGGQAKAGLAYAELARALARRGDHVHVFGAAASDLASVFASEGLEFLPHRDLASALAAAWQACHAGQTLLFSPACASFDAYPNFQARALEFVRGVEDLAQATRSTNLGD